MTTYKEVRSLDRADFFLRTHKKRSWLPFASGASTTYSARVEALKSQTSNAMTAANAPIHHQRGTFEFLSSPRPSIKIHKRAVLI